MRLAIQHGVPLLPVYAFGENQLFRSLGESYMGCHELWWVKICAFFAVFFFCEIRPRRFRKIRTADWVRRINRFFYKKLGTKMGEGNWRKVCAKLVDHNYSQSTVKGRISMKFGMELDECKTCRWRRAKKHEPSVSRGRGTF